MNDNQEKLLELEEQLASLVQFKNNFATNQYLPDGPIPDVYNDVTQSLNETIENLDEYIDCFLGQM